MRTVFISILLLVVLAAGYLLYAQVSGGAVPTFGLPIGGERAHIRQKIQRFFEHVKFKNKSALSSLVSEGSSMEDVESFLAQTFGADPNQVDLQSVHIDSVELDSSGTRARSIVQLKGQNLIEQKPFQATKLIFLYKVVPDDWRLDIKNLRL